MYPLLLAPVSASYKRTASTSFLEFKTKRFCVDFVGEWRCLRSMGPVLQTGGWKQLGATTFSRLPIKTNKGGGGDSRTREWASAGRPVGWDTQGLGCVVE